jgi:hypothetical protein
VAIHYSLTFIRRQGAGAGNTNVSDADIGDPGGWVLNKTEENQGDIRRFLCFFCAVCFLVFWRRRPDASKKQGSPSNAKASPCGVFASRPADFD